MERRCEVCKTAYPSDYRVCPKDGQPLPDPSPGAEEDPLIGEVLNGSFCIVGTIGEGGMGRVYEAEHVRLPRRYAVKVLAAHYARNAEAIGRFEREAQAAARVTHPNVLDVVDVIRARDGRPCIVTELLKGEELTSILARERKLSVLRSISIVREACRGLAAAHAERIVHRDLKPENLFVVEDVSGEERVKILDFGVAKLSDGSNLTRTGMIVGTPAYMAPEQARGLAVDGRTDLYALGAVLYHLVTGHPPFEGDEPAEVLVKVVEETPKRPREHDPSISEALDKLVMRLLARDPNDRPPSAVHLEKELATLDGTDRELDRDTMLGDPATFRMSRVTAPNVRPSVLAAPAPPPPVELPVARERTTLTDTPRPPAALVPGIVASAIGAIGGIAVVIRGLTAKQGFALEATLAIVAGLLVGGGLLAVLRATSTPRE
ncbi:MAG: serine/threonine-protein kinase [Polyangiaceae bacterium]